MVNEPVMLSMHEVRTKSDKEDRADTLAVVLREVFWVVQEMHKSGFGLASDARAVHKNGDWVEMLMESATGISPEITIPREGEVEVHATSTNTSAFEVPWKETQ